MYGCANTDIVFSYNNIPCTDIYVHNKTTC